MQMKPSTSLAPFLLLLLLLTAAEGIRFQSGSFDPSYQEIQEIRSSVDGSAAGEVVICRDGHCSGRSRKLMSTVTKSSTSESAKNKGVEVKATTNSSTSSKVDSHSENLDIEPPISEHRQSVGDHYPDIVDIAGMDYSPAKRKPPIHN